MNVEETWGDASLFGQDAAAAGEVGAAILSAADAERHCEELRQFDLQDVGSPDWIRQHKVINQLNLQAHHCVKAKSDNFVLEALVTFDKIALLIRELLVVEAWRVQIFPRLKREATKIKQGGLRLYFIHYHEVALVNLLEIILFHDYAAEAAGDAILELIDYCARKTAFLTATGAPKPRPSGYEGKTAKEIAAEIDNQDPLVDIENQSTDIDFRTAVVAVFILRFLTSHVAKLSVTVMTRMLETHDFVLAMVPLIENPPWVRKTKAGWEKYDDHTWAPVKPENLLTMSRCEGQPWLVLYNLLCDAECRKFYTFNTFRKDQLLRVRKYLNDTLKDQLPVLTEVQRYMDELVIMQAPPPDGSKHFIVQQVPVIRNSIIKGRDWEKEAIKALHSIFPADGKNEDLKQLADVFTADGVAELMGESAPPVIDVLPKTCVVSAVNANGQSLGAWTYALSDKHAAAPVEQDTSSGKFKRFTLTLQIEKGAPATTVALPADCVLQVEVRTQEVLDASRERPCSLSTNTICVASQLRRADVDSDELTLLDKVHWEKVGSLETGCVTQLKFQLHTPQKQAAIAELDGSSTPLSVYKFAKTTFVSVPSS